MRMLLKKDGSLSLMKEGGKETFISLSSSSSSTYSAACPQLFLSGETTDCGTRRGRRRSSCPFLIHGWHSKPPSPHNKNRAAGSNNSVEGNKKKKKEKKRIRGKVLLPHFL